MKRYGFLFVICLAIFMLASCGNKPESKDYETISIDELLSYEENGHIILDVRETDEFEAGHIPTARHLALSDIQAGNYELDPTNKYVIICRSGNRSQIASSLLHEAGYEVTNVSEGMSSWTGPITE